MKYEERLARWKDFKRLRANGLTLKQIADKYGIPLQGVSFRLIHGRPKKDREARWKTLGVPKWRLEGREIGRMEARLRDNFTCQDCGEIRDLKSGKRMLDVHHLNGLCGKKSRGYDSRKDVDGLITLCHRCHYRRHDFNPETKIGMARTQFKKGATSLVN